MTVRELQMAHIMGEYVMRCEDARPWEAVKCSRAAWYRFMASADCPPGLCLKLGRRQLLSLPVFLRWIGALEAEPTTQTPSDPAR